MDSNHLLIEELQKERSYSAALYQENLALLSKIARMKKFLLHVESVSQDSTREARLSIEVDALKEEAKHLRTLLRLQELPLITEADEAAHGPGCFSPSYAESSASLLTPTRSPQHGKQVVQDGKQAGKFADASKPNEVYDADACDEIVDVGPPLSPNASCDDRTKKTMTSDDIQAELVDKEDISASFREVDNDLEDPDQLQSHELY